MTIREMLYNFDLKSDNIDSKNAVNLSLPAKLYLLNEGQLSLVKKRYGGLTTTYKAAFEEIQKRRDEFQKILVTDETLPVTPLADRYVADLTATKQEYLFLARTNAIGTKGSCPKRRLNGMLTQTDDLDIVLGSPLEKSSFEWGEVVFRISDDKLQFLPDGFKITSAIIDYLRYPAEMSLSGFTTFTGTASTTQECELPRFMHYDIVDEAILIYSIGVMNPDVQAKLQKMANNE